MEVMRQGMHWIMHWSRVQIMYILRLIVQISFHSVYMREE